MSGVKSLLIGTAFVAVLPDEYSTVMEFVKAGGVAGLAITALIVVWRQANKQREKTELREDEIRKEYATLVNGTNEANKELAVAMTQHADATRTQTAAVFEMSQTVATVVRDCAVGRGHQVAQLSAPVVDKPR